MSDTIDIKVPDIGDFDQVEVIEVLVKSGDAVKKEDSLITLESDKATMEIPSPEAGQVTDVSISVGDQVKQGDVILKLGLKATDTTDSDSPDISDKDTSDKHTVSDEADTGIKEAPTDGQHRHTEQEDQSSQPTDKAESTPSPSLANDDATNTEVESEDYASSRAYASPDKTPPMERGDIVPNDKAHASPSVRKFARELGVDLNQVSGSGRKNRITQDDVKQFVKQSLRTGSTKQTDTIAGVEPPPTIDFSKFGEIESQPLTRINKLTGRNLHRSWFYIPHVTQFDKADITDLDAFRKSLSGEYKDQGIKITLLAFLIKASVSALKTYPRFNSSLDNAQENLILKKYYHIGVAVDTPDGLVVPVMRDVDQKGLVQIATEVAEMAARARDKKLKPAEMQGASFTISSLGGFGGTAFTPIVNMPEVAILGVSRAAMEPVYQKETQTFEPRFMLPLSLSYDHRVIDGVAAAKFTSYLSKVLSDARRLLL